MKPLTPFFFGALHDEGLRVVLKGMFKGGQLITCELDGVTWSRRPGEDCISFEARVTQDIRQMMQPARSSPSDSEHPAFVG